MGTPLLLLELNEVNFDFIQFYCRKGLLPNLNELIERSGYSETTSENRYEYLEPWIQWVTAHTGKDFLEHGIFRLGDIVDADFLQIWEFLESHGLKVGAVSPMNASNKLKSAEFFIPDPWTSTHVTAPFAMRRLFSAIKQVVNDNADAKITATSAFWLMVGLAMYAKPRNYFVYLGHALRARRRPWSGAIILDLLLADIFEREVSKGRVEFASLFMNAAAHIQHHYMFSSAAYEGNFRNPAAYISQGLDPVLDVYRAYDRIVGSLRSRVPNGRILIATGLHQEPHTSLTYYWRLKDHADFLGNIGVPFASVEPRMSRDFLVQCSSQEDARRAAHILDSAMSQDGVKLFEVDNRGVDLFVMLTYPNEITVKSHFSIEGAGSFELWPYVVFVALKNGEHSGIGYFVDSAKTPGEQSSFALRELPGRICDVFGLKWSVRT